MECLTLTKAIILLEAIKNTGVRQRSRIIEALRKPYDSITDDFDHWIMPSYAELAGLLKLHEVVPALVDLLKADDDTLQDACADSLMRIGTVNIVSQLADLYETNGYYSQTFFADVVSSIKCEESIAAARRLLENETDSDRVEFLLHAILMQFDPDWIQFV